MTTPLKRNRHYLTHYYSNILVHASSLGCVMLLCVCVCELKNNKLIYAVRNCHRDHIYKCARSVCARVNEWVSEWLRLCVFRKCSEMEHSIKLAKEIWYRKRIQACYTLYTHSNYREGTVTEKKERKKERKRKQHLYRTEQFQWGAQTRQSTRDTANLWNMNTSKANRTTTTTANEYYKDKTCKKQ